MNTLDLIEFEEGYRERAYHCSEGYPTIGIGTKLGPKDSPLSNYTFRCNKRAAKAMLEDEVNEIMKQIVNTVWFSNCNAERRSVLVSMCYQMGVSGVLKFKKMIAAMEARDWDEAARQALDSRWARQTPDRARRHAKVIRMGMLEGVYP